MVDGTNDQCSRGEDIDFELVGFSVHGQVMNLLCTFGQHSNTKGPLLPFCRDCMNHSQLKKINKKICHETSRHAVLCNCSKCEVNTRA